jgi:hypothetical protein
MDDVCWGTNSMLSKSRLRVRRSLGTQIVQTRFSIPYSITTARSACQACLFVKYCIMSKPTRLGAQLNLISNACYIC